MLRSVAIPVAFALALGLASSSAAAQVNLSNLPVGEGGNICARVGDPMKKGLVEKSFDINGDGSPNVFRWVKTRKTDEGTAEDVVVMRELDINTDGKVDVWTIYDTSGPTTRIAVECFDLDFDGRVDATDFYNEGNLVRKEIDFQFNEKPDLFNYYQGGKLSRKERDSDGDGRIDYWEYYEDGRLAWIGYDTNGDGNIDVRREARDAGGGSAPVPPPTEGSK